MLLQLFIIKKNNILFIHIRIDKKYIQHIITTYAIDENNYNYVHTVTTKYYPYYYYVRNDNK